MNSSLNWEMILKRSGAWGYHSNQGCKWSPALRHSSYCLKGSGIWLLLETLQTRCFSSEVILWWCFPSVNKPVGSFNYTSWGWEEPMSFSKWVLTCLNRLIYFSAAETRRTKIPQSRLCVFLVHLEAGRGNLPTDCFCETDSRMLQIFRALL